MVKGRKLPAVGFEPGLAEQKPQRQSRECHLQPDLFCSEPFHRTLWRTGSGRAPLIGQHDGEVLIDVARARMRSIHRVASESGIGTVLTDKQVGVADPSFMSTQGLERRKT